MSYVTGVVFLLSGNDQCDPNPCVTGICVPLVNGFSCYCSFKTYLPNGYEGDLCEKSELLFYLST